MLKSLAKSVLITSELTAAATATDAVIHKKMFESDNTTLIIYNEEMNDIMKIVKLLEESGLLIKDISETMKQRRISWNVITYFWCYFIRKFIKR